MKLKIIQILAYLSIGAASILSAQSSPIIYFGPYQQAHAGQFEGKWTRSDGTYQIVLTSQEGQLQAEYFNPGPIHVESTEVLKAEGSLILKVVLNDAGYPGSTYELEYLPQYRVLVGRYTIPGQEPADVYFTK